MCHVFRNTSSEFVQHFGLISQLLYILNRRHCWRRVGPFRCWANTSPQTQKRGVTQRGATRAAVFILTDLVVPFGGPTEVPQGAARPILRGSRVHPICGCPTWECPGSVWLPRPVLYRRPPRVRTGRFQRGSGVVARRYTAKPPSPRAPRPVARPPRVLPIRLRPSSQRRLVLAAWSSSCLQGRGTKHVLRTNRIA